MEKTEAKVLYMNGTATTAKTAANGITLPSATNISDPAGDFNNGRNKTIEKAAESALKKLFCLLLNDVYNAEKRLFDVLPGLIASATTLKLKNVFEHHKVPFPVLILRNSFLVTEQQWIDKIGKLGFTVEEFFQKVGTYTMRFAAS